jgi:hypothetical protein
MMDIQDAEIREELERRLAILSTEELNDPAHQPLPTVDAWLIVAAIVVTTVIGLVVLFQ